MLLEVFDADYANPGQIVPALQVGDVLRIYGKEQTNEYNTGGFFRGWIEMPHKSGDLAWGIEYTHNPPDIPTVFRGYINLYGRRVWTDSEEFITGTGNGMSTTPTNEQEIVTRTLSVLNSLRSAIA